MLTLLKERGWVAADTKSVSSTVSKIYQEEIEKEFGAKVSHAVSAGPTGAPAAPAEPAAAAASEVRIPAGAPAGAFAKTAEDIARTRNAVAKAATVQRLAP